MTHADALRIFADEMRKDDGLIQSQNARVDSDLLDTIADLLDSFQWRDKPPDNNTDGHWMRSREGSGYAIVAVIKELPVAVNRIHRPGDRWVKLPEDH